MKETACESGANGAWVVHIETRFKDYARGRSTLQRHPDCMKAQFV